MDNGRTFGDELRRRREGRGTSLRSLAKSIPYDAGALSRIESGQRKPSTELVQALDDRLSAKGELILLAAEEGLISPDDVTAAAEASLDFARWATADQVDQLSIDSLMYELTRIATTYVHGPLQPLFADLQVLRDEVRELLQNRPHPRQARELFFLGGVTVTLLAHVTDNLSNSMAAMKQALAAEKLAEQADHAGLKAWIAGSKALIAEWSNNPAGAMNFARRGTPFAPAGHQRIRLAAIEARSAARLPGKAGEAREALRQVRRAADESPAPDDLQEFGGVLYFPTTKALYYAGSTCTLLGDFAEAERCATEAIAAYESGPAEERSYGDESLARTDVAIARIVRHDLEGAADALTPVLELPAAQRIYSIGDGLSRVNQFLGASKYAKAPAALALREEIEVFDPATDLRAK